MTLMYKYKAYRTVGTPLLVMHSLFPSDHSHILSLLDAGYSASSIASSTGHSLASISRLCSRHRPHLSKPLGGCPTKLSATNIHHAVHLIGSGKAGTAVDVAKALSNITNVMVNPKLLSPNSEFQDRNSGTFGILEFWRESGRLAK